MKSLVRLCCETQQTSSVISIKPSTTCGPFRELKTMFQAGKRWVEELEKDNPNLSLLARAHSYLVENPFFLFVGAGIFLWVHTHTHTYSLARSCCICHKANNSTVSYCIIIEISVGYINLMHSVFSFHQDSHLLPLSGGGRSKEDHKLTTGADRKCNTSQLCFSVCVFIKRWL